MVLVLMQHCVKNSCAPKLMSHHEPEKKDLCVLRDLGMRAVVRAGQGGKGLPVKQVLSLSSFTSARATPSEIPAIGGKKRVRTVSATVPSSTAQILFSVSKARGIAAISPTDFNAITHASG